MLTFGETHSRATDPETSKAAARKASAFHESHAGRILLALQNNGPASAKHLERTTGLSVVQIDRRTCELQRLGLIAVVLTDDGAEVVREGCRVWKSV